MKNAGWSRWLDGGLGSLLLTLVLGAAQAAPLDDVVILTAEDAQAFAETDPFVFGGQSLSVHHSFAASGEMELQRLAPVIVAADTHFELQGQVVSGVPPLGAPLEKRGLGLLTLAGNNRHTSNTVLREGALRLKGDAALGNAIYTLEQSGGTVLQLDDGARVRNFIQATPARPGDTPLPGVEHTAHWNVEAGTATISSHVTATLPVHKTGRGTLHLTGVLNGGKELWVQAGALAMDGTGDVRLRVADGARLEGSGRVADLHVYQGGMLAPNGRDAAGTFTVRGNTVFEAGSVYHVNAYPDGVADLLQVSGHAVLDGRVQAQAGDGEWAHENRYRIVQADGGLADTRFAGVETNLAFLDPDLEYEDRAVYLTLTRNDLTPGDVGATPEEEDVGDAMVPTRPVRRPRPTRPQTEPPAVQEPETQAPPVVVEVPEIPVVERPVETPVVVVPPLTPLEAAMQGASVEQARSLVQQSSGSWHASVRSFLLEDSRYVRQAVLKAGRDALPSGIAGSDATDASPRVWAQFYTAQARRDSVGSVPGDRAGSRGIVMGMDAALNDDWRAGPVLAAQHAQLSRSGAQAGVDSLHMGWATHGDWNGMRITTALLRGWHRLDSRRTVAAGPVRELMRSSMTGRSWQAVLELAPSPSSLQAWAAWLRAGRHPQSQASADTPPHAQSDQASGLVPYLRHEFMHLKLPGHTETGGAFAHKVDAATARLNATTLGLRWQQGGQVSGRAGWLEADLGWRHNWHSRVVSHQRFAGLLQAGLPAERFASAGQPLARNTLALALEAGMSPARNVQVALRYGGLYGSGYRDHAAWADLRWAF